MNRSIWHQVRQSLLAGLIGGCVALGGAHRLQADDEKPKTERKDPPPAEKKEERRPDRLVEPANREDVAKLRKAISDAALKGDIGEVSRLAAQLDRMMRDNPGPRGGEGGRGGEPGRPGEPGQPGFDPNWMNRLRDDMMRSMKGFEDALENLKGQPEAQDAIRKAMDAYRRAMGENMERMGRLGGFGLGGQAAFGDPFGRATQPPVPRGGVLGVNFIPAPDYVTDLLDLPRGLGMIVQSVNANSPAAKAGFQRNDLLLTFAGEEVTSNPGQFLQLVERTMKAGKPVEAVVFRKGKKETLKGIELPKEVRRDGENPGRINFQSMMMTATDNAYKIQAATGDAKYFIAGETVDGVNKVNTITVTVGDSKKDYASVREVPAEHQPAIRQLLNTAGIR